MLIIKRYGWLSLVLIGLILIGCAGRDSRGQLEPEEHFAKAQDLFAREKWARAAEEFNWVVLNNPAGNRAAEAQYYYAECLFQQKLYVEAELEFERLLRRWANTEHLVEARYRSVQCLVEQSPKYYHDQGITGEAVDELQQFIDDFPDSEYVDEAEKLIDELRFKIARKYYEAGRQYLKWEESESARLYFNRVLTLYYDTELADQARLGMVISFLIEEDSVGAQAYLEESLERFSSLKLLKEAENFIARAQEGKFDLAFYQRLYK